MKLMLIAALCLVLLSAGCVEQKSDANIVKGDTAAGDKSPEKMTVTITSPKAGEILQGNEGVSFDATVSGGKRPLSYEWSSSIDGKLSSSQSFKKDPSKLSKGGHVIILKVTDASGSSQQGSVLIEVL
jgi:hypothetical protein